MTYKINARFTLGSNNENWILYNYETSKPKRHYFPTIDLLVNFWVELMAKNSLPNERVELDEIIELTQAYDALIYQISNNLSDYFKDITEGMNYKEFHKCGTNDSVSTPRFLHK